MVRGVGGVTRHDELGPVFLRQPLHRIVVDGLRLALQLVSHEVVQLAGKVHRAAVGKMSPLVKTQPHNRVAGLEQGKVDRHVCLGAAVGLHVGVLCPK